MLNIVLHIYMVGWQEKSYLVVIILILVVVNNRHVCMYRDIRRVNIRYTQKPIYIFITIIITYFTDNIWSYLPSYHAPHNNNDVNSGILGRQYYCEASQEVIHTQYEFKCGDHPCSNTGISIYPFSRAPPNKQTTW